jgi:hypothetical protein
MGVRPIVQHGGRVSLFVGPNPIKYGIGTKVWGVGG